MSVRGGDLWRAAAGTAVLMAALLIRVTPAAADQLGALVSPGRLSQPHASLEGIRNCQSCHEAGNKVTAEKCLSCHTPVAVRIRAKRGVHRAVQGECVTCHAEHQGATGELRPFDTRTFDHAREAGYPLDGRHAPLASACASCHKARTFLAASTACASCHQDVHKGTLGAKCETCHTTRTAFKDVRQGFDHTKAAFKLEGAHERVACESCHRNQQFKGVAFATCASCHKDPHTPKAVDACTSCHTPASWRTRRFDHATTTFPLSGKHQAVACAGCHVKPALQAKPRADTCAACHQDPHRGRFTQDCKSCHDERGFAKAPFDHATTPFPLTGRHAPAACTACHTSLTRVAQRTGRTTPPAEVDFGGLKRDCASCHDDVHRTTLGTACESCHTTERFAVAAYTHRTVTAFFAGAHGPATCASCHLRTGPASMAELTRARTAPAVVTAAAVTTNAATPVHGPLAGVAFTATSQACATCHADVHLGQVGTACETCHAVAEPKFAVTPGFDHARTRFRLGGKHGQVPCAKCHESRAGAFPSGPGTAVAFTGLGTTCASCHRDSHLGQLGASCETCHSDRTFSIASYTHRRASTAELRGFFVGAHAKTACATCHVSTTAAFASGRGTAVRYAVSTTCTTCHRDEHDGALGPRCGDCHKPDRRMGRAQAAMLPASGGRAR